jgi:hypothetical protein
VNREIVASNGIRFEYEDENEYENDFRNEGRRISNMRSLEVLARCSQTQGRRA